MRFPFSSKKAARVLPKLPSRLDVRDVEEVFTPLHSVRLNRKKKDAPDALSRSAIVLIFGRAASASIAAFRASSATR